MKKNFEIFVDGSSLGNPGKAGCGFIIKDPHGNTVIEKSIPLGIKTNNEAEYMALILALKEAKKLNIKNIRIFTDSQLLCLQLKGEYKVRAKNLKMLYNNVLTLLKNFEEWDILHIGRELNKNADKLAKKAAMEVKA